MQNEDTICGCGKPTRYMLSGGRYSCNKYARCPSYEELWNNSSTANARLLGLLSLIIPNFDIYNCSKDIEELLADAKSIIERNKAAYTLYLNKGE